MFTRKLFRQVYIPLGIAFIPFALALEFWVGFKSMDVAITYALAVIMAILGRVIWLKVKQNSAI
ncbi:hypothetical protein ACFQZS_16085 [Mucilaginibacter calamicampi]|uniref:Uncharacterized protein n=1 Tax=Mucilaginibacter calamicampi TaxID=1302352 RepID=A0ABW2Z039_9SPHI